MLRRTFNLDNHCTHHPKIVVIGAGSLFFGRQAIWQMIHSPHLNCGTLALVDSDSRRLEQMATLAQQVVAETGVALRIEAANHQICAQGRKVPIHAAHII